MPKYIFLALSPDFLNQADSSLPIPSCRSHAICWRSASINGPLSANWCARSTATGPRSSIGLKSPSVAGRRLGCAIAAWARQPGACGADAKASLTLRNRWVTKTAITFRQTQGYPWRLTTALPKNAIAQRKSLSERKAEIRTASIHALRAEDRMYAQSSGAPTAKVKRFRISPKHRSK